MTKKTTEDKRARWNAAIESVEFPDIYLDTVKTAVKNFEGDFNILESAVGALFLGTFIGWRPLFIIHAPKTIKKYESILGIGFRDFLPETTDLSDRSKGYAVVMTLSNFWSAVRGQTKVDHRGELVGIDALSPGE
jgi:hypothetical protein